MAYDGENKPQQLAAVARADPAGRFTTTALPGNLQPVKDINLRYLQICNLQSVK